MEVSAPPIVVDSTDVSEAAGVKPIKPRSEDPRTVGIRPFLAAVGAPEGIGLRTAKARRSAP